MTFDIASWTRLISPDGPVWVCPTKPDWFVPDEAGDEILRDLRAGRTDAGVPLVRRFLDRLPPAGDSRYPGRPALLGEPVLRELWLHVTDRCNLACSHCLFGCSAGGAEMPTDAVLRHARRAHAMGARVFALTGGEPTIHPEFTRIVEELLAPGDTNVVVLTNGMTLETLLPWLAHQDSNRLHLQLSVDGLEANHDRIRGPGTFEALSRQLAAAGQSGAAWTLSMCVDQRNQADMAGVVRRAGQLGADNVHFMWYFARGRGGRDDMPEPEVLAKRLIEAAHVAERVGVSIDNIEAMRTQVFAPAGTKHDGSGAGIESAALAPDGKLYPSAAMVGEGAMATDLDAGLEEAWRGSPVLQRIRQASIAGSDDPLRLILGGGDADHSYAAAGTFMGDDPYLPMHRRVALWLIGREGQRLEPAGARPALRLKMGDVLETCGPGGEVGLVHNNCLLAVAGTDGRSAVKQFYAQAATDVDEEILNPVCYPDELLEHVPERFRFRGYGCGSPVLDAEIAPGERVVDLGCGTGVECFLAAKAVGPGGHVTGVDMLAEMLERARAGAAEVTDRLGYRNTRFVEGYLEDLPLADASADVVLSNCVLNLSTHKRRLFAEIARVLAPGGRLVVSDVVTESDPPAAIRNDEVLRGQCIAGAMTQRDLAGLIREAGLGGYEIIRRNPYRVVGGHPFYSLTFRAVADAPEGARDVRDVMYRGPLQEVTTRSGAILPAGRTVSVPAEDLAGLDGQVLVFDASGSTRNAPAGVGCCCSVPPEESGDGADSCCGTPGSEAVDPVRHASGCLMCGAELTHPAEPVDAACALCGRATRTEAICAEGHFVCDSCHAGDAAEAIRGICECSCETDMLALLERVVAHPAIAVHGPEYHAIVPAVILAAYRNTGGDLPAGAIQRGIERGLSVPGGACGFLGICGAAAGAGAAFSLILQANPLDGVKRQQVQQAVSETHRRIASRTAARCCLRESVEALRSAAALCEELTGIRLAADAEIVCDRSGDNDVCIGGQCGLFGATEPIRRGAET
jgi:MoaA/NifB/PqqE/SkfB family radical SAM enzyme/SAM-dependent methyltransferase